jgi:hypothetical protein
MCINKARKLTMSKKWYNILEKDQDHRSNVVGVKDIICMEITFIKKTK